MDPERARKIAEAWSRMQSNEDSAEDEHLSSFMREELTSLLSDSAVVGVSAAGKDAPVLALDGERFIRMRGLKPDQHGGRVIRVQTILLDPSMGLELITETLEHTEGRAYVRRTWHLGTADKWQTIEIKTCVSRSQSLHLRGESADEVMREVARKLGWPMPAADSSPD